MWAVKGRLIVDRDVQKSKVKTAGNIFADSGKTEGVLHIEMVAAFNSYTSVGEINETLRTHTELRRSLSL